jgi:hypothetical protein
VLPTCISADRELCPPSKVRHIRMTVSSVVLVLPDEDLQPQLTA